MASEEWIKQLRANEEIIARAAGYQPFYSAPEVEWEEEPCPECGRYVTIFELENNIGICDRCITKMPNNE